MFLIVCFSFICSHWICEYAFLLTIKSISWFCSCSSDFTEFSFQRMMPWKPAHNESYLIVLWFAVSNFLAHWFFLFFFKKTKASCSPAVMLEDCFSLSFIFPHLFPALFPSAVVPSKSRSSILIEIYCLWTEGYNRIPQILTSLVLSCCPLMMSQAAAAAPAITYCIGKMVCASKTLYLSTFSDRSAILIMKTLFCLWCYNVFIFYAL